MKPCIYDGPIGTDYQVHVRANGTHMLFTGHGVGHGNRGDVSVDVRTSDKVPAGFHPAILAFCLLTGQADMGPCLQGAVNPLRATRGAYKATRVLTLDRNFGELRASYRFTAAAEGVKRTATFEIEGSIAVPKIVAIRPAFETWVPDGPGKMRGHFTMVWVGEDGRYIKGETDTYYDVGVDLPEPIYRRIEFAVRSTDCQLTQNERIAVFPQNATLAAVA
jgi:hypothetical protein